MGKTGGETVRQTGKLGDKHIDSTADRERVKGLSEKGRQTG